MDKRLKTMIAIAQDCNPGIKNFRLVAGVFLKNKLISLGMPQYKTHPIQAKYTHAPGKKVFIHAEVDALNRALARIGSEKLSQATLAVARVAFVDDSAASPLRIALAKPCKGCMNASFTAFGIKEKNIIWTEDCFEEKHFLLPTY